MDTDLCARVNDDKVFYFMASEYAGIHCGVLQAFRNIQEGLRKYSQATKQTDITISGGMERYEADKQMDLLFTSADRKLYVAKNNGKNRIVE